MTREDEARELLAEIVDLEAPAEHLPEPMCERLLSIIDRAKALTRPSSPASADLHEQICAILLADPACNGRVTGEAIDALAALTVPARPEAGEAEREAAVCAQCNGFRDDLAPGRDPEELCDPCYNDAVSSLPTARADIGEDAVEGVARLKEALEAIPKFVDDYFAPWGSWKTAWWEGEVSDDAAFSAENALKAVANKASAALASLQSSGQDAGGSHDQQA